MFGMEICFSFNLETENEMQKKVVTSIHSPSLLHGSKKQERARSFDVQIEVKICFILKGQTMILNPITTDAKENAMHKKVTTSINYHYNFMYLQFTIPLKKFYIKILGFWMVFS